MTKYHICGIFTFVAEQYSVQFDTVEIDKLPSGTGLPEIVEANVTYCRSTCLVPNCGIKAMVEREPITDFGKAEGIDVVTISCDDSACGQNLSIPRSPSLSKVTAAGLMTILKVHRELAVQRGLI